jgi:hypothetical protein
LEIGVLEQSVGTNGQFRAVRSRKSLRVESFKPAPSGVKEPTLRPAKADLSKTAREAKTASIRQRTDYQRYTKTAHFSHKTTEKRFRGFRAENERPYVKKNLII